MFDSSDSLCNPSHLPPQDPMCPCDPPCEPHGCGEYPMGSCCPIPQRPCKREEPWDCHKRPDPCQPQCDPCDPCKWKEPCKRHDPCEPERHMTDPCRKWQVPCEKRHDPCEKRCDPCDPCKREDPCGWRDYKDPCKKVGPLEPQVICSGRVSQRCAAECITVCGVNVCQGEPLTLVSLNTGCEEPTVCVREDCYGTSPMVAEVSVPLVVCVRDGCGRVHNGRSTLTVRVRLPKGCAQGRGAFLAFAKVRLIDAGGCSCNLKFDVKLEYCVEVFLVRIEPCGPKRKKNNCCKDLFPPLPYFPKPWYIEND